MHIKDRSLSEGTVNEAPGLEGLMKSVHETAGDATYPPVEAWNPPYCGDIGLKIGADGTWYYQGSPIGRKRLVKLFASVLRKDEDGQTYLVTPQEKVLVEVADAPLLAVEMTVTQQGRQQILVFRTNLDDVVLVEANNPIRFQQVEGADGSDQGLKPYILVRGRLEALVTRALYYDLIDLAVCETTSAGETLGVWSGGTFFEIAAWKDEF